MLRRKKKVYFVYLVFLSFVFYFVVFIRCFLTSTCDKMNAELELLTAGLSASFVAFDEKVVAEAASAKVVLEASHASKLLDQVAHFDTKHAT